MSKEASWNVFKTKKEVSNSASECAKKQSILWIPIAALTCVLKFCIYILAFLVVLGGSVSSKISMLLMTSQIQPRKISPLCNEGLDRMKKYLVEISTKEQVVWIWYLCLAFAVPEILTYLGYLWKLLCGKIKKKCPPMKDILIVLMFEGMQSFGFALLVFSVLPKLDVLSGLILSYCFGLVPGTLTCISHLNSIQKISSKWDKIMESGKILFDILSLAIQFFGLLWLTQDNFGISIIALVLISAGWWENYVDEASFEFLGKMKSRLTQETKTSIYFISSPAKMIIFLGGMLTSLHLDGFPIHHLFATPFHEIFTHENLLNVTELVQQIDSEMIFNLNLPMGGEHYFLKEVIKITSQWDFPLKIAAVHSLGTLITCLFAKWSCKTLMQSFGFAIPLTLTVPVAMLLLGSMCNSHDIDSCGFHDYLPDYLFWNCSKYDLNYDSTIQLTIGIGMLLLFCNIWCTFHIYWPKCNDCDKLANSEKLFVNWMYSTFAIEQSLSHNRQRQHDSETCILSAQQSKNDDLDLDKITKIYACATMWHENPAEMMEMLKSLYRMDMDQCTKRIQVNNSGKLDSDYYEFETHIFFDDAFEISEESDNFQQVNKFVRDFMKCVWNAGEEIYKNSKSKFYLTPYKKIPTPYGGKLVYQLPGKTLLQVHLKDKSKIRHKKRWSQCMYLYYLLGHRLMENPELSDKRKEKSAENIYILTLDGDIDFQPSAVKLLVDLMKKDKGIGAACGRIHPVGSGFLYCYQKFEYWVGHVLQKATEHVFGSVMCSPGCFSLFRAKALMHDNVMNTYTTKSEEPMHYVQYDQGEDRWLCTLLLQMGFRVEYCSVSDSYTHCPTEFNEFFNQRRRWVPSTVANIWDLLRNNIKTTMRMNDNISIPFVCYQILLMGGTIIGPGAIFLMLMGGTSSVFGFSNWDSLLSHGIPISFFVLTCLICKTEHQLLFAKILSLGYGLFIITVCVMGITLQLQEDGHLSPSALFLILLVSIFVLAAILHPLEGICLLYGLAYVPAIPSMYLILIIYSIANVNSVSWGTREVAEKKSKKQRKLEEELEKQKKIQEQENKNNSPLSKLTSLLPCGLGDYLRNIIIPQKSNENTNAESTISLESDDGKSNENTNVTSNTNVTELDSESQNLNDDDKQIEIFNENNADSTISVESDDDDGRIDDENNPYWTRDPQIVGQDQKGFLMFLSPRETKFWKDCVAHYLEPIDNNDKKQADLQKGLNELRNHYLQLFLAINFVFVLGMYLCMTNKDKINIPWFSYENKTITEDHRVLIEYIPQTVDPMGLILQIIFIVILVIQAFGMLLHRKATVEHILVSTDLVETSANYLEKFLNFFSKKELPEGERIQAMTQKMLREYDAAV